MNSWNTMTWPNIVISAVSMIIIFRTMFFIEKMQILLLWRNHIGYLHIPFCSLSTPWGFMDWLSKTICFWSLVDLEMNPQQIDLTIHYFVIIFVLLLRNVVNLKILHLICHIKWKLLIFILNMFETNFPLPILGPNILLVDSWLGQISIKKVDEEELKYINLF